MQSTHAVPPLLAATLLISGCVSTGPGTTHRSTMTEDGRYRINWHITPDAPLTPNEYFEMIVTIENRQGDAPPQEFRFDATMPAHRHGMNTLVTATRTGETSWRLQDVNLHMPGEWVMTFDVTDERGVMHRASETVTLE